MNIRLTTFAALTFMAALTACNRATPDAQANQQNQPTAMAAPANPAPGAMDSGVAGGNMQAAGQPQVAPMPAQPAPAPMVTIPAGTSVNVRLRTGVSSAQSRSGDRFEAVLDEPLKVHGETVIPAGTPVVGRVLDAESSGRLEHPGRIVLGLAAMNLNGSSMSIETSTVSAQGESHKRRNLEWIGGGAGAGALLGGIFGGGKGALIGSAAGAGAGTATAAATGKKEVAFAAGHRLTFRLSRSATVTAGS